MRSSDWSSDVCSSDLRPIQPHLCAAAEYQPFDSVPSGWVIEQVTLNRNRGSATGPSLTAAFFQLPSYSLIPIVCSTSQNPVEARRSLPIPWSTSGLKQVF